MEPSDEGDHYNCHRPLFGCLQIVSLPLRPPKQVICEQMATEVLGWFAVEEEMFVGVYIFPL